ncbi:TPA: hypothetical protein ACGPMP_004383 [Enterobacter roggenkampii]|uniref:hypothetical protein n=1 Tax=Enterobacter roggenkampii TaxID=1812935 RepID=UPI0035D48C1D
MKRLIIALSLLVSFGASAGVRVYQCGKVSVTATDKILSADGVLYYKGAGVVESGEVIPVTSANSLSVETYTGDVVENYVLYTGSGVSFTTYTLVAQMDTETPVGISTANFTHDKFAPVKLIKESKGNTVYTSNCKMTKDTFK